METIPLEIIGSAEALPLRQIPTREVAELCGLPEDEAIERSGVRTRYWLSDDEDPLVQGTRAAREAIAAAGLDTQDIDLVLNASGTPMQAIPDGGALIAAELGLRGGFGYSLHGTCISFLPALREAALLLDKGMAKHILIVSTEGGSRGLNFAQPESALLIGDAAAAVVVRKPSNPRLGITASSFKTDTRGVKHAEIRGFGSRKKVTEFAEHVEDYTFDMKGLQLLKHALVRFPPFLEGLEPGLSTSANGLDRIVPHQTSSAGMEMMSRFWGWDKMTVTLAHVGNTIAASIPLAYHRADIKPGERVLLVGTGAGTHYAGVILQC